jgi:hypothetical protein
MRGRQSQKACKTTTEDTEKKIEGTESAWWGADCVGQDRLWRGGI